MTPNRQGRPTAEWILFGAASAILAAIVVALLVLAVQGDGSPPTFQVEPGVAEPREGSWYLPVRVRNAGDETAAEVQVEVTLEIDGDRVGGDQVVDFVSGGEEVSLTFVLPDDPATGTLEARVTGYQEP